MAKKQRAPAASGAPKKAGTGPSDATGPIAGGISTNTAPKVARDARLNTQVEWRDTDALKVPFAGAVRAHTAPEYSDIWAAIVERGILDPLKITPDGRVLDGNGRLRVARARGMKQVPCIVVEGLTDEEERSVAVTLNADRRQLTRAERDELIRDALNRDESTSDREIAKKAGASHGAVAKRRKELEATGQIARSDERRDRHGVTRPASANRKAAVQPAQPVPNAPDRSVPAEVPTGTEAPGRPADGAPVRAAEPDAASNEPGGAASADRAANAPQPPCAAARTGTDALSAFKAHLAAFRAVVPELRARIRAGDAGAPDKCTVAELATELETCANDLRAAYEPY